MLHSTHNNTKLFTAAVAAAFAAVAAAVAAVGVHVENVNTLEAHVCGAHSHAIHRPIARTQTVHTYTYTSTRAPARTYSAIDRGRGIPHTGTLAWHHTDSNGSDDVAVHHTETDTEAEAYGRELQAHRPAAFSRYSSANTLRR